jgi:hypothetical protein
MDALDVSPAALVDSVVQTRADMGAQQVQIRVMKKAMDAQASTAAALLNSVPAPLPLATSGALGTKVNALV